GVIPEKAVEFYLYHTPEGFLEDLSAHFGSPFRSVSKNNRYFHYPEAIFQGGEFHFNLKGITDEFNTVERDGGKYDPPVAFKPCCGIAYLDPGDQPDISGSKIKHQHPAHRPVY